MRNNAVQLVLLVLNGRSMVGPDPWWQLTECGAISLALVTSDLSQLVGAAILASCR